MAHILPEFPLHRRDKMENLLEGFEAEEVRHVHAAILADPAQVVALEVGDHDEFRNFL